MPVRGGLGVLGPTSAQKAGWDALLRSLPGLPFYGAFYIQQVMTLWTPLPQASAKRRAHSAFCPLAGGGNTQEQLFFGIKGPAFESS